MRKVIGKIFKVVGMSIRWLGCFIRLMLEILLSIIGKVFRMDHFKHRHTARTYEYAEKLGQRTREIYDECVVK